MFSRILMGLVVALLLAVLYLRDQTETLQLESTQSKVVAQTLTIEQDISPIAYRAMGELHRLEKEVADDNQSDYSIDSIVSFDWMYQQ